MALQPYICHGSLPGLMLGMPLVFSFVPAAEGSAASLLDMPLDELLAVPITSTSYFTETSLDVASTVSVITADDWQKRGARRNHDALAMLPGVAVLPNFLGQESVFIRGYARTDSRGVATLWDGVPINTFNLGTADVDRPNIQLNTLNSIEVTRGPGSAFYGADAFHGAISLNAFESEEDVSQVSAEYATNKYFSTAVNHSQSMGNNQRLNVAVAVNGQPDQDFSYTFTDPGSGAQSESEREYKYLSKTAVIKLNSDPKQAYSYRLGLYYDDSDQDGFYGQGSANPQNDVSDTDTNFRMAKLELKKRLSANSSLEVQGYSWLQNRDFANALSFGNRIDIHGKEKRSSATLIYNHDNLYQSTQFSTALSYRRDDIDDARRRITNAGGDTLVDADLSIKGADRNITSFLLDAKTTLMSDKLILRYGFRYDNYSDFGGQFTPRLGIIYALDEHAVIKLLYGNAFRAPTAIELIGSPFITGDPDIEPETIDTYELAYVRQHASWQSEVVFFVSEWSDAIKAVDTNADGSEDQFSNQGKNLSRGVEISHRQNFALWVADFSASYVTSKNKSTNTRYVAFPKYIINLGVGYAFKRNWSLFVNNLVRLDASEGDVEPTIEPESLKDYWRTDVNLTHQYNAHWQFFANARNIFDRDNYFPSVINAEGGIQDEEISLLMGLRYKF